MLLPIRNSNLRQCREFTGKFEVKFLCTMGKIDIPICNFLSNNFLRFVILQKNRHTAKITKERKLIKERLIKGWSTYIGLMIFKVGYKKRLLIAF